MSHACHCRASILATVEQVLPTFGLAYLHGDDEREWTVTKSTRGEGLAKLSPGARLRLTLERHGAMAIVSQYDRIA